MNDALERARLAYERAGRGCIVSTRRGEEPRYATVTELAARLGPEEDIRIALPHLTCSPKPDPRRV